MLVLCLTQLGHWVESTGSAGTAIDRLQQDGFDVLMTDLWLPDAHDWDFLGELRARHVLPPHVVSVEAVLLRDAAQRSKAAGCCAHIAQSFRVSEVVAALEAICSSAK